MATIGMFQSRKPWLFSSRRRQRCRPGKILPARRMRLEILEDRRLLSLAAPDDDAPVYLESSLGAELVINAVGQEQRADQAIPQFVAGEILVGFEGEVPALYRTRGAAAALEAARTRVASEGLHSPRVLMEVPATPTRAARVATLWQLPAGTDVLQTAARLAGRPGIAYAEPNYLLSIAGTPNDPRFSELWGLHNTGQSGGTVDADIDAPEAWDITTGSRSIVVGVIDTGVDYTHPDLASNIWTNPGETPGDGIDNDGNGYVDDFYGWDFCNNDPMDDNGHGTHVAGTIGAVGDNAIGVVGVNWNVQIMPLKFLGADGSGTTSAAVEAVSYATMMRNRGVSIMLTNNSWGGGPDAQTLYDAISARRDADMLFVAAAGNSNSNNRSYPAGFDLDNIISVAATDRNDAKASFSNYGSDWVDLGAPGVDILSTLPGEGYGFGSGTSMAAPHVSGVAALAWSLDPQATYQTVRDAIFEGVDSVASMAGVTVKGGRLNANNTLGRIGMVVSGSSPAAGEIVTTPPAEFVIDFSFPVKSDTLDASDLTVNDIPANSVTLVDPDTDTARFHFNSSPVTAQGLQTMRMAAGSVASTPSVPREPGLHEWVATFRYDVTRMQVVATEPADASVVTLPFTTLTIHLNEPVDPSTIGIDDLVLNQGRVVGAEAVDVDGDGNVDLDWVRYTLDEILSEGTLAVVVPAGALADEYGNPIVKYQGSFELDFGTVPLPVPLARQQPWGSLVYSGTVTGSIRDGEDTDSFTLDLAAGQGITAVVDPDSGLQPTIKVFDPFGNSLGSASASAAGGDAVVQMLPVETAGLYRLEVSGVGGSTGSYALQVVLNAAVESELHGGADNDTRSVAQDLDFLALGTGSRAAVLGQADGFDTSLAVTKSYSKSNLHQHIPTQGTTTSTITVNDSYPIVDVNVQVDITHPKDYQLRASLSAPGGDGRILLFSGVGGSGDNFTGTTLDDEAETSIRDAIPPFTGTFRPEGRLAAFDGMNVQGTWTLQVEDTVSQDSGKLNSWGIEVTTAPPLLDYYKFTLGFSERATLALTALAGGTVSLELQDASGNTVATGTPGKANVPAVIDRTLSPGTYYAVVKGDSGAPYSVTVLRQAAFDLEPNNELGSAQDVSDVSGQATLVGALLSPDPVFVTSGSRGLMGPADLAFGPDGTLYVSGFYNGTVHGTGEAVHRYNGVTGEFRDVFVSWDVPYGEGMTFGPDGDLYLADGNSAVLRFDGTTGGFISVFASGGALPRTPVFGPDGTLYVTNRDSDSVTRYNGTTGAFIDEFVARGSGGLSFPWGLAFGPDSTGDGYPELYVASYGTDSILRYDGKTGAFIDEFVPAGRGGLDGPRMIRFGPDANGDGIQELYVAAGDVLRYDGKTGAFLDVVVARGEGGLDGAVGLTFGPDGSLYVTGQGSFSKTMNHGIFVFRTPLRDSYRLQLPEGTRVLNLATTTPLGDLNRLDPKINLYDMNGSLVASDDNSATDGRNALLSYSIPPEGASAYYYVEILPSDDPLAKPTEGEYILQIETSTAAPEPGILVNKTPLATEEGAENTFTVCLNTAPSSDVTVELTIAPAEVADEATLSPTSLTFTSENWYLPQTVTVTGVRDFVDDGDVLYRIELAAPSSDPNYDGKQAAISAINLDRDTAGITLSPTRGLITTEAGGTATFTVVLDSQPTADVSIEVSSSDRSEGLVSTGGGTPADSLTLTFTPENWNTPQTVTVTGVDDSERDGDVAYTIITAAATSSDPNYDRLDAADVSVTNRDNGPPIGNPNDMYVWDIEFESRTRGKAHDERIRVTVRRDSDADGVTEDTDETVAGASVTVVLTGPKSSTLSGTTDSTGVFTSGWVTKVPNGTYLAEVTALTHSVYVWNGALDPTVDNDTDLNNNGLPDQEHINPHSGGSSVNFSSTSTATVDSNSAAAAALRQPNSQPPQAELADAALVGLRFGSLNEEGQDHDQADLTEFLELDLGPGLLKDLALAPRRWYSLRGNGKLPAFELA